MRATDLTSRQRADLQSATAHRRDFFDKFKKRMNAVGWDKADDVYRLTIAAYDAAHELVRAIYASTPPEPPAVKEPDRRPPPDDPTPTPYERPPDVPWVGKSKGKRRRRR